MRWKKQIALLTLAAIVLAACGFGLGFYLAHYTVVDAKFYPRSAQTLDLNGQNVSVSHYEKLQKKLPYTKISWDIPVGESRFPNDAEAIRLDHLTERDIAGFRYFTRLKQVDAAACDDYAQLRLLQQAYPQLEVVYQIRLGETAWDPDTAAVEIPALPDEELSKLEYLPELKHVICTGGDAAALQRYCQERGMGFGVRVGGQVLTGETVVVLLEGVTDEELPLLKLLPLLMNVHIVEPLASAENLLQLQEALPQVKLTWEKTVSGVVCGSDAAEVDLSGAATVHLGEVAELMDYFPLTNTVYLGDCGADYEELAGYREQCREYFDLVWVVTVADSIALRTDATAFIPYNHNVYFMDDEDAFNLRYCEKMVYMDLSRLSIQRLDFLETMQELTYLDLSGDQVKDISALRRCKKLKFLELDNTPVKDLTPLTQCAALEDLNLSRTYGDFTAVEEMTWLKNLWVIQCDFGTSAALSAALPETRVQGVGTIATENGWRDLQNYQTVESLRKQYFN